MLGCPLLPAGPEVGIVWLGWSGGHRPQLLARREREHLREADDVADELAQRQALTRRRPVDGAAGTFASTPAIWAAAGRMSMSGMVKLPSRLTYGDDAEPARSSVTPVESVAASRPMTTSSSSSMHERSGREVAGHPSIDQIGEVRHRRPAHSAPAGVGPDRYSSHTPDARRQRRRPRTSRRRDSLAHGSSTPLGSRWIRPVCRRCARRRRHVGTGGLRGVRFGAGPSLRLAGMGALACRRAVRRRPARGRTRV